MHTLALPKYVFSSELGPEWLSAHYELAFFIKKKARAGVLKLCRGVCRVLVLFQTYGVLMAYTRAFVTGAPAHGSHVHTLYYLILLDLQ